MLPPPFILPPPQMSLCHFNLGSDCLCLSLSSVLSSFSLSPCCFLSKVSDDSSHIFCRLFFLLACQSIPPPTPDIVPSPGASAGHNLTAHQCHTRKGEGGWTALHQRGFCYLTSFIAVFHQPRIERFQVTFINFSGAK